MSEALSGVLPLQARSPYVAAGMRATASRKQHATSAGHQGAHAISECGATAEGPLDFNSCPVCCAAANRQRCAQCTSPSSPIRGL